MRNKTLLNLIAVFVIAAVLVAAAIALPGLVARAQGGNDVSTQATVGAAFTYQGRLMYNGAAISGTCDLSFGLYDSPGFGGSQVGTNIYKTGVQVSNGYFSVDLDFGSDAFTGEARYLQITIDSCPGGASNATLNPMVVLDPTPYALSLRPGAVISGAVSGGSGVKVVNSNSSGASYGVYGESAAGFNGVGVYGKNTSNGSGVYGQSAGAGVGVYGQGGAYGLYSNGNAHVEGQLTWKTITSYLSIPPAAFNPMLDGEAFFQTGNSLSPHPSILPRANNYVAPVALPHGATVTKFTFYWKDNADPENGYAALYRIDLAGNEVTMAFASTSGSSTASSSAYSSISNGDIDNSKYAYYIFLNLPHSDISIYGVVIEYTIDRPY